MSILKSLTAAAVALPIAFGALAAKADDIVEIAAGNADFETLVAAVEAAGLIDTLKGRLRADRRSLREAAGGHGRKSPAAGEPGSAHRHPDLPRRAGQGDVQRHRR